MMLRMRPPGSPASLERRRRKAIALFPLGHTYRAIAEKVGAALSSVVRWRQSYRQSGRRGLKARPASGRPCRLTNQQKIHLGDYTGARRAGRRLRQRSMDAEAHRGSGEEVVRRSLWCLGDMAAVGRRFALERPETDPARHPTRRGSHRPLEALCVASYKKTLAAARPSGVP